MKLQTFSLFLAHIATCCYTAFERPRKVNAYSRDKQDQFKNRNSALHSTWERRVVSWQRSRMLKSYSSSCLQRSLFRLVLRDDRRDLCSQGNLFPNCLEYYSLISAVRSIEAKCTPGRSIPKEKEFRQLINVNELSKVIYRILIQSKTTTPWKSERKWEIACVEQENITID